MDPTRLQLLLDRYVDGLLSSGEKTELEMMLLRSPEARALFWEHADWNALLREHGEQSWGRELAQDEHLPGAQCTSPPIPLSAELNSDRSADLPPPGGPRRPRGFGARSMVPWSLGVGSVAVVLLAIWLQDISLWRTRESANTETELTTDGVAILTQTVDAHWDNAVMAVKVGSILTPGNLKLESGLAQIEFLSGGTVILEGPAELNLVSFRQAYLARGKVRVHVPPQASGFEIRSSATDVVDLGTEFGMQVGNGPQTEVQVFDGKVELYEPGPARAPHPRLALTAGRGVRLDPAGQIKEIAADGADYPSAAEVNRRIGAQVAQRQLDWHAHGDEVRRDARVLRYYTFDGQQSWDRVLRNQRTTVGSTGNAAIIGSQWTDGRWPGKSALDFRRIGDRVRLSVEGTHESLTLAASIRVDALENRYNSIFMCDDFEPGGIHWQITREGRLALGVQAADRKSGVTYLTPALFGPEKLGQWVHLAVVFDGAKGQVTQYVDGREVSRESIAQKIALYPGAAQLGNWSHSRPPKSQPIRNFSGRIEEFILFGAALAPQEIARLAKLGSPPL